MVDSVIHVHPIDGFYPGQEPLPGTLTCWFCGKPMTVVDGPMHAKLCALDAWDLETKFPILEQRDRRVRTCDACQRSKGPRHQPYGEPTPVHSSYHVSRCSELFPRLGRRTQTVMLPSY